MEKYKAHQKDIDDLLETLDDIKYDSLIFIFGIGNGEYLDRLSRILCSKNKVIIFEPKQEVFEHYKLYTDDNIEIIFYEKESLKQIFFKYINLINFNNIYFHAYSNYEEIYKEGYEHLVENLDWAYINASSQLTLANRFREVFIQNMLANLKVLNKATPIHHYIFMNKNVPAIIVSAGPSLDKQIKDMLDKKGQLKDYFIIAGSRTVRALMQNGIKPDIIVSIDPIDANYDMMKDYLDLDVPLVFYEYSNRYLVRDYQGEKIYIASLLPKTIEEFRHLKGSYLGGSVAHTCVDMANMLGCSPILLVGQDLAYTYDKHHSDTATYERDKTLRYEAQITVEDVFGKQVKTTLTLNHFKKKLEDYIALYQAKTDVVFVNCSYGAKIQGAAHKELREVFKNSVSDVAKKSCIPHQDIHIDSKIVAERILRYIDECVVKATQGLELCNSIILENNHKSLIDIDEEDIDLQRILYILKLVNEFENAVESHYLGGYFSKFKYDIKQSTFNMLAKDYHRLTSDLQHQAQAFKIYFQTMQQMLEEVKRLGRETVTEFYK